MGLFTPVFKKIGTKIKKINYNKGEMEENMYMKNPQTGRPIRVNGATWKRLVAEKIIDSKKKYPTFTQKKFVPPVYETLKNFASSLPVDKSNESWELKVPKKKGEREFIHEKCGSTCFLIPSQNKFPICNKTLPCTYNCRGLNAATSRGARYGYTEVAEKSKQIKETLGCYKNPKK